MSDESALIVFPGFRVCMFRGREGGRAASGWVAHGPEAGLGADVVGVAGCCWVLLCDPRWSAMRWVTHATGLGWWVHSRKRTREQRDREGARGGRMGGRRGTDASHSKHAERTHERVKEKARATKNTKGVRGKESVLLLTKQPIQERHPSPATRVTRRGCVPHTDPAACVLSAVAAVGRRLSTGGPGECWVGELFIILPGTNSLPHILVLAVRKCDDLLDVCGAGPDQLLYIPSSIGLRKRVAAAGIIIIIIMVNWSGDWG